ncbi:hypothetical protein BTJ39_03140 [Izhakiella australiensis]|uniref:Uncharacterized protein n=1 Tax=Izhakiella australiensis TaxID=1926881 RepID=A0A1S8YTK4_9GAMM|nr:efflux RND transporter periplasmic adaptor subunit [Izhakiella australiensis]OON42162.1 hypothetical protein BTJ39_03140 [Izhakiella australiensis]
MCNKLSAFGFSLMVLVLSGCDGHDADSSLVEFPAAVVSATNIEPSDIAIKSAWPARISPFKTAEIRPQVGGIINARFFVQGSEVRSGQPLFQIDRKAFEADVEMASAALQRAMASQMQLQLKANRLIKLKNSGAVSLQAIDDAKAEAAQAAASVAEAKATLKRKKLDLAYSTVRSPIEGRIDQAVVTEGALVAANSTQALAVVQQIDPVYIDAHIPASELKKIQGGSAHYSLSLSLVNDSGEGYDLLPTLLFSGVTVNNETGDVFLRAQVNNPDGVLMPGMYVNLKIEKILKEKGLLVPAQAIQRRGKETFIWSLNKDDVPEIKNVTIGEKVGRSFLVSDGVSAGERIVVEGQDKLRAGHAVKVNVWKTT